MNNQTLTDICTELIILDNINLNKKVKNDSDFLEKFKQIDVFNKYRLLLVFLRLNKVNNKTIYEKYFIKKQLFLFSTLSKNTDNFYKIKYNMLYLQFISNFTDVENVYKTLINISDVICFFLYINMFDNASFNYYYNDISKRLNDKEILKELSKIIHSGCIVDNIGCYKNLYLLFNKCDFNKKYNFDFLYKIREFNKKLYNKIFNDIKSNISIEQYMSLEHIRSNKEIDDIINILKHKKTDTLVIKKITRCIFINELMYYFYQELDKFNILNKTDVTYLFMVIINQINIYEINQEVNVFITIFIKNNLDIKRLENSEDEFNYSFAPTNFDFYDYVNQILMLNRKNSLKQLLHE